MTIYDKVSEVLEENFKESPVHKKYPGMWNDYLIFNIENQDEDKFMVAKLYPNCNKDPLIRTRVEIAEHKIEQLIEQELKENE